MKLFIYSAVLLSLFAACRHQKATTSTTATATTSPAPAATPSYTMTTTQGDVQIQTDESVTATITIDNPPEDSVVTTVVAPAVDTGKTVYRLTISFISKGEGIDYKTQESFENWLKEQPKRPSYEVTHWGREGETNYCLKLNELSTREQGIFVRDVRTQLTDKPLVFVSEYAACKGTK
jgi:hypothetical protein